MKIKERSALFEPRTQIGLITQQGVSFLFMKTKVSMLDGIRYFSQMKLSELF